MEDKYDFGGWATVNDLRCSDGLIIAKDAFKHNDGEVVPLVWNHQHNSADNVMGKALLHNEARGVYAYCSFNDTDTGKRGKALVKHGDISSLSICAGQLEKQGNYVMHGDIKEVSLVLAGANPGASINEILAHSDDNSGQTAYIYTGEDIDTVDVIMHSEEKEKEAVAEEKDTKETSEKTVGDIIDTMNEDQVKAMKAMIGAAVEEVLKEKSNDSDEEEDEMKHNAFYGSADVQNGGYLTHSDQMEILNNAKKSGATFKSALKDYADAHSETLMHANDGVVGFEDAVLDTMFPDYKEVRGNNRYGEVVTNDMGWVDAIMSKTQKVPYSRLRTSVVDVRDIDTLQAKGYKKGNKKALTGNYSVVRRTTDPQTIYVKSALNRDDVVDITDFDYVAFQKNIDEMNLKETLAIATMFGDGREESDVDKIAPEHIRPIWTDDELYTIHKDLDVEAARAELQGTNTGANFGENYIVAEAMINALTYANEDFRGTGTPDMFITPHLLNVMTLARDLNGRRIYETVSSLATALNVGSVHKVTQMKDKIRTDENGKKHRLLAIIVNMADYAYGSTKGGDVATINDFDIDFNQLKSLMETRKSGTLTRIKSAIVIEEPIEG